MARESKHLFRKYKAEKVHECPIISFLMNRANFSLFGVIFLTVFPDTNVQNSSFPKFLNRKWKESLKNLLDFFFVVKLLTHVFVQKRFFEDTQTSSDMKLHQ